MSRSHLQARALLLASGVLFVVLIAISAPISPFLAVAMVALVLGAAWNPHTVLPLVAMGSLVAIWVVTTPPAWSVVALPAAWCLAVLHTAAALCASIPPQAPIPVAVWQAYGRRLGIVAALTTVLWSAWPLVQRPDSTGIFPAMSGLVAVLALVVVHRRSAAG